MNVGEAAHIYGAHPGSARYDPTMASADRADITNAIWLCRSCHKIIDDDPEGYPSGLLFEWRREHEKTIGEIVGKSSLSVRARYEERKLEEFGRLSYLAERIILDKGEFWEHRLAAEVLRYETAPVFRRWAALSRQLYMRPFERVSNKEALNWILDRNAEIRHLAVGLTRLMSEEFERAWGPPGVIGDDIAIVETCRLFAEMCKSALTWEESIRFTVLVTPFEEVQALYVGLAGRILDESAKLPKFLADLVEGGFQPGAYQLDLKLTFPDNWEDEMAAAIDRAARELPAVAS